MCHRQFALVTLIVVSTLLNGGLCYSAEPNEKQAAAIAYFKKLGGKVTVDEKSPGNPVIGIDLSDTKVTDAGLMHLKGLTSLKELRLWNTKVTDAGLVYLKGLAKLRELNLGGNKITDAGLEHLRGLTNLQKLSLSNTMYAGSDLTIIAYGTKVTQAGIKNLEKALPKCDIWWDGKAAAIANFSKLGCKVTVDEKSFDKPVIGLNLRGTKITDNGLVHLKGLTKLQELVLHSALSDAGLVHLKGLTSLQYLSLNDTHITDAGLVHLKGLTRLKDLRLHHNKVTDAGLVHLKGLTSLIYLSLRDTMVTQAGIDKLQKALPKCDIEWEGK